MLVQTKGGYDCEFVEPPPAGLETKCSVCLLIYREPHMVRCCSHRFCHSCINPIKVGGKSCPLCKATTFELMHDKQLERSLKDLKVCCVHAESGCKWTGELRLLDNHLNVNPESKTLLDGCGFIKVHCIHAKNGCEWTGELQLLDKHLNVNPESETPLRGCGFIEIKCIHCGDPCQRNLFTNHQIEECQKWPTHRGMYMYVLFRLLLKMGLEA